jgi:hypothetical protein
MESGAVLDLFELGGGGGEGNFAALSTKSLRPLINISFAKIVGVAQYQKKFSGQLICQSYFAFNHRCSFHFPLIFLLNFSTF